MRHLILSVNYAPEPTGFSQHVSRLSEYLVRTGDEVTVITGFPFAPNWKRWKEYDGKRVLRESVNGVETIRVSHFVPRRPSSKIQRIAMEGTFSAAAARELLRMKRQFDSVLYVGAQPTVAMLARIVAAWQKIPYVVWINDLAAEAARDVGIVRSNALLRALKWFEYSAYRKASGAIVLCEAFRRALIGNGYPDDRIRVIGSPINIHHIKPVPPGDLRKRLQIPEDCFVVLFAGSMGLKQGLLNVIEAARLGRDRGESICWVIVGEGEARKSVERSIAEYELTDVVKLLPLQPEESLPGVLAAADVLLLNQLSTVKDTVIPSKLLTYMSAGKPVISAVNATSEAAKLMEAAHGGILVQPENPAALLHAATQLQRRKGDSSLPEIGFLNRAYAVQNFDENNVFAAQRAFLRGVVSRTKLRILFLNHNVVRAGGTYFRAFDIARHLVRRGHSVTLLTISLEDRWRLTREVVDGVEIVHTPDLFWGMGRSGWDPWDTAVRIGFVFGRQWDLVHAWDCRPVVILPALAARFGRRRKPVLMIDWCDWWGRGGTQIERGGGWTRHIYNFFETWFEESFRRYADGTTVISSALRDRAKSLGVPSDGILLLPQGCERNGDFHRDRESARRLLGFEPQDKIFITLGVLNVTDAALLFKTIREVRKELPAAKFVIMGRNRAVVPDDLKMSAVREEGYVPADVLDAFLAAADAHVVPLADNVASRARWPSRVNLSLSRGLPVVIPRVGDLPQLLEAYDAAVVTGSDPAALARGIILAASDAGRAAQMSSAARKFARELLPWEHFVSELENYYLEIAKERNLLSP